MHEAKEHRGVVMPRLLPRAVTLAHQPARMTRRTVMRPLRLSGIVVPMLAFITLLAFPVLPTEAGLAGAEQGEQRAGSEPDDILLNFQDVDLAYVFTALAEAASLNVMYSDLPRRPVTLRTAKPVPLTDIPELIRTLAAANDVEVIEDKNFLRLAGVPTGEDAPDRRSLYIYRLRHSQAEDLAVTLQALFGGVTATVTRDARDQRTLSQQLREAEQAMAAALQRAAEQREAGPVSAIQRAGSQELEGNILVVPDQVTNSLLVRATPGDWSVIEQAVEALDLRPLQVVIEVVVAEVRRTRDLDFGPSVTAEHTETRGATQRTIVGDYQEDDSPDNILMRIIRNGSLDVQGALSFLASSGQVRILQRPVLMAQNNQPARILVGAERPFVQASVRAMDPTDPTARDQFVQYRDVGTVLDITPIINEDGYVNLRLTQQVSSATQEIQFGAPVISTREAETQLLAANGQTVVIGGLVDSQTSRIRTGVPLLKDIPVLGWLFGRTRDDDSTGELFLFLTPHIVAADADMDSFRDGLQGGLELLDPVAPIRSLPPPDTLQSSPTEPGGP